MPWRALQLVPVCILISTRSNKDFWMNVIVTMKVQMRTFSRFSMCKIKRIEIAVIPCFNGVQMMLKYWIESGRLWSVILDFDGQIVHRIRMVLYIRSIRWREPLTFPTGNETAGGDLIDTTMCYMFLFNRERTFHNGPSWIERLSHLLSIVVLEEATSLLLLPFTTTLPHSKN